MNNLSFGEKPQEWSSKQGGTIPVIISNRYTDAKAKAVELISSKKYGLVESDFWILMNETKSKKMMYNGLIVSHNGCLKINDSLPADKRFKPECVTVDINGYCDSLVYTYCCPEQGIFEVGEVSKANCKNAYPYAMALKRCMDRVILKNSKIAYSGIYSESESDEFTRQLDVDVQSQNTDFKVYCSSCKREVSPQEHDWSIKHFKRILCRNCQQKLARTAP